MPVIVMPPSTGVANEPTSQPSSGRIQLSREHVDAVNRPRRIVMNYDALATIFQYKPPNGKADIESLKQFMLGILDLGGSQIDSVGWCWSEGNEAPYPSKILPTLLDIRTFTQFPDGTDAVRICCDETRRRGIESFFSLRINGGDHDRKYIDGTVARVPLKQQHPEWLINWNPDPDGPPQPIGPHHSVGLWNFVAKGVRDHKIAVLREIAENYDFDGIEVDFARASPVLPLGRQWENRAHLTDFMRRLRITLLEVADKRGRPLLLSARVPETLVGCHFDGIDVETWARDQLVDILVLGVRSLDVDIAAFRRITTGTPIKLYPCNDFIHHSDGNDPGDTAAYGLTKGRAVYANWWHQQPDGVYTFNYTYHGQNWSLYREIGSPESLRFLDKTFAVQRRGGLRGGGIVPLDPNDWATPRLAYATTNMLASLPTSLDSAAKADTLLQLHVADNVHEVADRLEYLKLSVRISRTIPIEVRVNNMLLTGATSRNDWWDFEPLPITLAAGPNLIGIRLSEALTKQDDPIKVENVELQVDYR